MRFRSHIDTTGVQALVDTRNEVERWADRSVEVCPFIIIMTGDARPTNNLL